MKRIVSLMLAAVLLTATLIINIPARAETGFYATAELLEIKEHIEEDAGMNEYATVQGACTDGRYAYFAVQQGSTTILKYDMNSWELEDKRDNMGILGHANDMTYNPKRNWILVANNGPNYDMLYALNPDTLEVVATVTLKLDVYSVAYNPERDIYIVGITGGYDFAVLNNKFKMVKRYKGRETPYTRQGCDCDENYIYFSQSGGGNAVVVYDYDGKYAGILSLGHSHEVENIFHVKNQFYATLHYYGNSVQRVGLSDDTQIRYGVFYDPGEGDGEMASGSVHYGETTPLRKNTFTKPHYFFGGWRAKRSSDGKVLGYRKFSTNSEWLDEKDAYEYYLYNDEAGVSETVRFGSVTMTAFWICEYYVIRYDPGDADGWMPEATVGYYNDYLIPDNGYSKPGYVFTGFSAYRDYDNKYYGYRKDSKIAEWLEQGDLFKKHTFQPGETLSSMTFDGVVMLKPEFRFAYTYSEDGTTLLEYIGYDKIADIPDPSGKLEAIGGGAFRDNYFITEMHIPSTVNTMESHAVSGCSQLSGVYFSGHFPDAYAPDCISDCDMPSVYIEHDGKPYFIGYTDDPAQVHLLKLNAAALDLALKTEKEADSG